MNVVHMCTVHRGAEESTSAFQQHCGDSFLRGGELEREGRGKRSGSREKRMKLGGFRQRCCKGEWMRAGAVQPATWAVLTRNNGSLSVALNPLVACWERAAVRPPLTTDTLSHAHPLDNWILHPRKSSLSLVMSPVTRGPDRNSPRINFLSNEKVWWIYWEAS